MCNNHLAGNACIRSCRFCSLPLQNTEFGYSRKDIILLGVGLIGLGYALYYGLQVGTPAAAAALLPTWALEVPAALIRQGVTAGRGASHSDQRKSLEQ